MTHDSDPRSPADLRSAEAAPGAVGTDGSGGATPIHATRDLALLAAVVLLMSLAGRYALAEDGFSTRLRLGLLVSALFNLGGMVFSINVSRLLRGHPSARFWRAMACAGALFTLADLVQFADPGNDPVTAVATRGGGLTAAAQGLAVFMIIAAMLTHPIRFASRQEQVCFWLDMIIVLVGAAAFELSTVSGNAADGGHVAWSEALLGPVASLITVFALAKLLLRGTAPFALRAGVAGVLAGAAGTAGPVLVRLMKDTGQEHWLVWTMALSSACYLVAPRLQLLLLSHGREPVARRRRRPYSLLPYAATAFTYAILLVTLPHHSLTGRQWLVLIAAVTSTGLVVLRQVLAFQDNARLLARLRAALAERDALQSELRRMAFHDSLTGLANRALFSDRLRDACHQAQRDRTPLGVMVIDLDDFKPVNDRYGHATGDALLTEMAIRLRGALRQSDTVARLGGDEFAVVLHHPLPDRLDTVAERVCDAISTPLTVGPHRIRISASVGVTIAHSGRYDPDELFSLADHGMYRAKRRCKGSHTITAVGSPAGSAEHAATDRSCEVPDARK